MIEAQSLPKDAEDALVRVIVKHRHDHERYQQPFSSDDLKLFLMPKIISRLDREQSEIGVGTSKIGGLPDVTAEWEWPTFNGRNLWFICQLNLEAVHLAGLPEGYLPASGVLLFFYDLSMRPWGTDPEEFGAIRVYYFPDLLQLRPYVNTAGAVKPEAREHRLTIDSHWTLPELRASPAFDAMWEKRLGPESSNPYSKMPYFTESLYETWSGFVFSLEFDTSELRPPIDGPLFLGYPDRWNFSSYLQVDVERVDRGFDAFEDEATESERKHVLKAAEDWIHLGQFDIDDDEIWGEDAYSGVVHFWIRKHDLKACDFSKVRHMFEVF